MSQNNSIHDDHDVQPHVVVQSDRWVRWGVVTCAVLAACVGAYALSARAGLQRQISGLEVRTTDAMMAEVHGLREETASLTNRLSAANDRLDQTNLELAAARNVADELRRAQSRTAKAAAENASAVTAVRQAATARKTEVEARLETLAADVTGVTSTLATARTEIADGRGEIAELRDATTAIGDRVTKNSDTLLATRRLNEREVIEFDIAKGSTPQHWTVADIRVELKKADVKHSRYDVMLHVDDQRLERKGRSVNEPVAFLVGPTKLRYELVVTSVEHDRVRGYLTVPKDRTPAGDRRASLH